MRTALSAALLFALTLGVTDARAETPQKNVPSKAEKLAALGVVNVWAAPGSVLCTPPKGDLPSVVRGIVVAEHYLIGPAKYFRRPKTSRKTHASACTMGGAASLDNWYSSITNTAWPSSALRAA